MARLTGSIGLTGPARPQRSLNNAEDANADMASDNKTARADHTVALNQAASALLPPSASLDSRFSNSPVGLQHTADGQPAVATLTEYLIHDRDTKETLDHFLERARHAYDRTDVTELVSPGPLAPLSATSVKNFQSYFDSQLQWHMLDPGLEYDTDEERSGTFDSKFYSMTKAKRRRLLTESLLNYASEHGIRRGKWVIPTHTFDDTIAIFRNVVRAYRDRNNLVTVEAKWWKRDGNGIVILWTPDMNDRERNWTVIQDLWAHGVYDLAYYKPEAFSVLGLRSGNEWGLPVTLYSSNELARSQGFRS